MPPKTQPPTYVNAHAIVVGNPLSGFRFYGPFLEVPKDGEDSPLIDLAQDLGFEGDAPDGAVVVPLVCAEGEGQPPHASGFACGREGLVYAGAPEKVSRLLLGLARLVASRLPAEEPLTALASSLVQQAEG